MSGFVMKSIARVVPNVSGSFNHRCGEMPAFRVTDGQPQWNLSLKGCIRSIGSSGNLLFAGVQEGTIYAYELSAKP